MDYSNELYIKLLDDVYRRAFSEKKVLNQEDFGKKLGFSNKSYISDMMNGTKRISNKVLKRINTAFGYDAEQILANYINPEQGTVSEPSNINYNKKEVIALGKKVPMRLKEEDFADAFPDWKGLPFYNVPVTASFIETYRDEHIYTPQFHLRDPRFKDCDFAAIVTGDSMHSEIRHGDFIICKEIIDRRFIVYGDIYYVVSTNGLETCKYINADKDDKNNLMLIAKNEHISPAPLPKDMVLKLYKVKGILRGY